MMSTTEQGYTITDSWQPLIIAFKQKHSSQPLAVVLWIQRQEGNKHRGLGPAEKKMTIFMCFVILIPT